MDSEQTSSNQGRTSRVWLWLKRLALGFILLLLGLALAGMFYQATGSAADARRFPPPGELVDVGGFRMHLFCQGEGSPVVVLDTLSGGTSSYWAWVQPELAKTTRVCTYDRAGRLWSEAPAKLEGTYADHTVEQLHALLNNASLPAPYILVGHSIAGIYARLYADRFPEQVAGIVLIDAAHPHQFERVPAMAAANQANLQQLAALPWMARLGLFRLYFASGGEIDFQDLPPQAHDEVAAAWSSPRYFDSLLAEAQAGAQVFKQGQALGDLGDLPLVVVSAGVQAFPEWQNLQDELASLSTNSSHLTIPDATHVSLAFNREHALQVSAEIAKLVETVRTGQR